MRRKIGLLVLLAAVVILTASKHEVFHGVFQAVSGETEAVRTLVLDAGHGGFDGGAQSADGTTEQFINLCIARTVQSLCGLFGEQTLLTRENEEALAYQAGRTIHENKVADIKAREQLANQVENGVFLSIHLNKFQESQYYGAQTFYSRNHAQSKVFAESIQNTLLTGIDNGNTRKAKPAPETVYLMKKLQCPALIVECGFLSNPEEAAALRQTDYQKRLALCIVCGYLSA